MIESMFDRDVSIALFGYTVGIVFMCLMWIPMVRSRNRKIENLQSHIDELLSDE